VAEIGAFQLARRTGSVVVLPRRIRPRVTAWTRLASARAFSLDQQDGCAAIAQFAGDGEDMIDEVSRSHAPAPPAPNRAPGPIRLSTTPAVRVEILPAPGSGW